MVPMVSLLQCKNNFIETKKHCRYQWYLWSNVIYNYYKYNKFIRSKIFLRENLRPTKIIINRLEIAHKPIRTRARFQSNLGTRLNFIEKYIFTWKASLVPTLVSLFQIKNLFATKVPMVPNNYVAMQQRYHRINN